MRTLLNELIRYGLVSAVALTVDFACLLWWAQHLPTLLAAAASFVTGGLVAYGLSVHLVFTHRRVHDSSLEASLFVALGLAGLALNLIVIAWATRQAHWPLAPAKAAAALVSFGCNYALRRYCLFSRSPPSRLAATVVDGARR